MDESPNVHMSIPIVTCPMMPSMLGFVPMVGSSVMVGFKESELQPRNVEGFGSRLGGAHLGTKTSSIVEKGKRLAYADLVEE